MWLAGAEVDQVGALGAQFGGLAATAMVAETSIRPMRCVSFGVVVGGALDGLVLATVAVALMPFSLQGGLGNGLAAFSNCL